MVRFSFPVPTVLLNLPRGSIIHSLLFNQCLARDPETKPTKHHPDSPPFQQYQRVPGYYLLSVRISVHHERTIVARSHHSPHWGFSHNCLRPCVSVIKQLLRHSRHRFTHGPRTEIAQAVLIASILWNVERGVSLHWPA